MSKTYEELQPYLEKTMALQTAMILFEWDDETLAPKEAGAYTSKVIGTSSEEYLEKITCDEMRRLVVECKEDRTLSEMEAAIVREMVGKLEEPECTPPKEYREFIQLSAESTRIWTGTRKNKGFEAFVPTLQKVVGYQKKFASYRVEDGQKLYDVMLDTYEKDLNMEALDESFRQLKDAIVSLLREIAKHDKEIDDSSLTGDYPMEKQEEIAKYLTEYAGFDFDKSVLAVGAHPFTTNLHSHDVRITTACNEYVDDSIFSVAHEAGYDIYELGVRDELTQTMMGQGVSMGMHESQSRFFENIVDRNRAFWVSVYGKLQELFPGQLGDIDLDTLIDVINKVQPSLIRTQTDESTYSLHMVIRYEIEKMLMEENLEVEKLPDVWVDRCEEYLGMHPEGVSGGVLQDIHQSQGSSGYLPSYTLGSAFGAQLHARMKEEVDFEELLEGGKIDVIREYLKDHVHQFGKLKTGRGILKNVTGEDFSPKYYAECLAEKYRKIYEL